MYKLKSNKKYLFFSKINHIKKIKTYFKAVRKYLLIKKIKNNKNIKSNKYLKIKSCFRLKNNNKPSINIYKKYINHTDIIFKIDSIYLRKTNNLSYKTSDSTYKVYKKLINYSNINQTNIRNTPKKINHFLDDLINNIHLLSLQPPLVSKKQLLSDQNLLDNYKNKQITDNYKKNHFSKSNNIKLPIKNFISKVYQLDQKSNFKNKIEFARRLLQTPVTQLFLFKKHLKNKQGASLLSQEHQTQLKLSIASKKLLISYQRLLNNSKNKQIIDNKKKNRSSQFNDIKSYIRNFGDDVYQLNQKNNLKNKRAFARHLLQTSSSQIFIFNRNLQNKQSPFVFNQKHQARIKLPFITKKNSLPALLKTVKSKLIFDRSQWNFEIRKTKQSLSRIKLQDNSLTSLLSKETRSREKYLRISFDKNFTDQLHNNNKIYQRKKNTKYDSIQTIEKIIKNHAIRKESEKINSLIHHTYSKQIENNEMINKKINRLKQDIEPILKINIKNNYPIHHKIRTIHLEDLI